MNDNYIKMSEKAEEIQGLAKPKEGDIIINTSAVGGAYKFVNYLYQPEETSNEWQLMCNNYSPKYLVWIPRIEDLGKIIRDELKEDWVWVLHGFWDYITNDNLLPEEGCSRFYESRVCKFNSMQELWLAFAMYELYQKIWDNKKKEWVNE